MLASTGEPWNDAPWHGTSSVSARVGAGDQHLGRHGGGRVLPVAARGRAAVSACSLGGPCAGYGPSTCSTSRAGGAR
jgi:hypothetical protein